MNKHQDDEWKNHKQKKMIQSKKYNESLISNPDFNVIENKKISLDDDILKMIWIIRKEKTNLHSEKQVIKEALKSYINYLQNR